ncbi:MAG: UDP-glucose 4-epimerase GalE, partial [Nannocystaceae bacterium]
MRVLVTGGAGYIGSITVEQLILAGHDVVVLDSLATGHRDAVAPGAELAVHSVLDGDAVAGLLREHRIEAVLHCAARSLVGQSMADPGLYFRENVVGGIALLDALREAGVDRLVFSCTAAVYGEPERVPIRESAPTHPVSPYGASKRAFESAMGWYAAYGLRSVSLRYFNVAGASEHYGERHDPETHLIPNVLKAAMGGAPVTLFGDDYPTADGTAIRDFIHVLDLADAHIAALELTGSMEPGQEIANLGSGSGFSVKQVLDAATAIVGHEIPHSYGPRRAGDP